MTRLQRFALINRLMKRLTITEHDAEDVIRRWEIRQAWGRPMSSYSHQMIVVFLTSAALGRNTNRKVCHELLQLCRNLRSQPHIPLPMMRST